MAFGEAKKVIWHNLVLCTQYTSFAFEKAQFFLFCVLSAGSQSNVLSSLCICEIEWNPYRYHEHITGWKYGKQKWMLSQNMPWININ